MQLPGQDLQSWVLKANATVGASADAQIRADFPHISGEHLKLTVDPSTGIWSATDVSRHGSNIFAMFANTAADETQPVVEVAMQQWTPVPLPHAGCLRLGPKATHPLLHFMTPHLPPRHATQGTDVQNAPHAETVKPPRKTAFDIS